MCYYNSRELSLLQITTTCYYNITIARLLPRQLLLQFTTGITIHDIITIYERKHDDCSPPYSLCTDRPPFLSRNRRRAPSPIFTEGRGVCTQATLPIQLRIFLFPVNYFELPTSRTFSLEG